MKTVDLTFLEYTWDEYFYVIANKSGILVAYKGGLDLEGFVKMDEILCLEGADKISDIYESDQFAKIRKGIGLGERLFFSFVEVTEGRDDVVENLNTLLKIRKTQKKFDKSIRISCNGACALFPEELLSKES